MNGTECDALVDTGCTRTVIHSSLCIEWKRRDVCMVTVSGELLDCAGTADVRVQVPGLAAVVVDALVVKKKPLGFCAILGMDGVKALGGVTVRSPSEVRFSGESEGCAGAVSPRDLVVDKEDFCVTFDMTRRQWTVRWKWSKGEPPNCLKGSVSEYAVKDKVREEYEQELTEWIKNGWLQEYDEEKHGPPKGLIPLMAVPQENKGKVRPVLDFREVNSFVDTYTADVDVCSDKLREWRQMGSKVALLDLKKAYLQIHVDESLWPYQTVQFKKKRYCLTRLGFGLSVAPRVMKTVLETVAKQDENVEKAVSSYVDDVLVNEEEMPAEEVAKHLRAFGLECKEPTCVREGARVLGLRVWEEQDGLKWKRDNNVREIVGPVTKRKVFSLCGQLTGHLPSCGWLRPAASFLKRRANEAASAWDDVIDDPQVQRLIDEIMKRVAAEDPARGRWDVKGDEVTVWVDASMLALGVVMEVGGEVVEDGCWLRHDDGMHINLAELEAALKGVNMAILWGASRIRLMTDSRTVFHWISDLLSGKARLKTKATSEMLIRRRLSTLKMLADEYGLDISVHSVASAENKSDVLTRVPEKWLGERTGEVPVACAVVGAERADNQNRMAREVERIHHASGHPGVRRTLYFAKRANVQVTRRVVQSVVSSCQTCRSIDPAPEKWTGGHLAVETVWDRVAIDVTHFRGRLYLTVLDCGPSRFAIWRPLRFESATYVIAELLSIFCERGPPSELLADNATVFHSRAFLAFVSEWGTRVRYRAAHVPSGNGIVERNHRSVKVIAARKECDVTEAVYLYNVTPRDDTTDEAAPASVLYRYRVRVKAVDPVRTEDADRGGSRYRVGDAVWVKPPRGRCDDRYDQGEVTGQVSTQTVEVDGVPRHVRHLRPRTARADPPQQEESDDEGPLLVRLPEEERVEVGQGEGQCRRSQRTVRAPVRYGVDQDRGGV